MVEVTHLQNSRSCTEISFIIETKPIYGNRQNPKRSKKAEQNEREVTNGRINRLFRITRATAFRFLFSHVQTVNQWKEKE